MIITPIPELERLLDAKQAAEREWEKYADVLVPSDESRHAALIVGRARNRWIGALTDDTLRTLIDAVRAAHDGLTEIGNCEDISECAGGCCTYFDRRHEALYEVLDAALDPLFPDTCPTCHGHGGGGGFDRNGSHSAGELREYPCPECGKEADYA